MPGSTTHGIKNAAMSEPALFPENVRVIRHGGCTALGRRVKTTRRGFCPAPQFGRMFIRPYDYHWGINAGGNA